MGYQARLRRARRAVAMALVKAASEERGDVVVPRRSRYTPPKRDLALVERGRAKVLRQARRRDER